MLGYVGRIQHRLNEPVICALAQALPWADIKLAPVPGEMEQRRKVGLSNPFANYANIHILENMPKAELVDFVRAL